MGRPAAGAAAAAGPSPRCPQRRAVLAAPAGLLLLLGGPAGGAARAAAGPPSSSPGTKTAYFAAGDAAQVAPFFRELRYRGVQAVTPGLADGVEAVKVEYDPARAPFSDLLRVYFRRIDGVDEDGQFAERGERYTAGVWTGGEDPRDLAEARRALQLLAESGVFGNVPGSPLAVGLAERPAEFEPLDADELPPGSKELKQALKKSGRYRKLDDPDKGLWGFVSYCENRVCGFYTNAPKCVGACRKYYPDGSLGLGSLAALELKDVS